MGGEHHVAHSLFVCTGRYLPFPAAHKRKVSGALNYFCSLYRAPLQKQNKWALLGSQKEKPVSTHSVLLQTKFPDPSSALAALPGRLGAERERLGREGVWGGTAGAAVGNGNCRRSSPQCSPVDGFALDSCWAIKRGKKNDPNREEWVGWATVESVSSAFVFLIRNDAVLVWQLSLEDCINSQTCVNGFES